MSLILYINIKKTDKEQKFEKQKFVTESGWLSERDTDDYFTRVMHFLFSVERVELYNNLLSYIMDAELILFCKNSYTIKDLHVDESNYALLNFVRITSPAFKAKDELCLVASTNKCCKHF